MGYLQLAEDPYMMLAEDVTRNKDKYIFIPEGYRGAQKDTYVREDVFDDMPEAAYRQMMIELGPYQNTGLSKKGNREERRAKRKSEKEAKKTARREAKQKRVETRSAAFGNIGKGLTDVLGNVMGTKSADVSVDTSAGGLDVQIDTQPSWFERNKVLVLGGAAVVIIGGVLLMRKKK